VHVSFVCLYPVDLVSETLSRCAVGRNRLLSTVDFDLRQFSIHSLAIATNCLIILQEVACFEYNFSCSLCFEHVAYQAYSVMLAIIDHQALCTDLFCMLAAYFDRNCFFFTMIVFFHLSSISYNMY
jgi:hypothetical protein